MNNYKMKFKKGDRVRCIDAGARNNITTGKEYLVTKDEHALGNKCVYVHVPADDGGDAVVFSWRFELVTLTPFQRSVQDYIRAELG